jgi:hypothetical protein
MVKMLKINRVKLPVSALKLPLKSHAQFAPLP